MTMFTEPHVQCNQMPIGSRVRILHFSESATLLLWGQQSWSTRHRDLLPLPPMYMMIMYSWYGVA